VTRHLTIAAVVVAAAAAAAALATSATRPALLGAGIAAVTAFASLGGFWLTGRSAGKPVQKALAVFAAMFLLRIVLVSLGLLAVHRMGESVVAFAIAFFVPYFAFAAIEGGYVHALGRQPGKTA
jgi:hypothetical protein